MFAMCIFLWLLTFSRIKLPLPQPCLLYNRGYNVALPWQKTISVYQISFGGYIETNRYWKKTENRHISHRYDMYGYIPTHYMHIYTACVGTVCKLILVHQLVLYCCIPDAASCLRPFRDSRGVFPPEDFD